ncbi:MAG: DoxX family membrane protein [Chloroflexia bacterium]|nr:DoxX family membrane protein [Chloroflexia bacterium]
MASSYLTSPTSESSQPPVSPTALGRGLAALRIFMGVVLFANGIAKLTGVRNIELGWYRGFLIVRNEARNILSFEVNERGGTGTRVPFLKEIVNDIILANWDTFQWLVTFTELGIGALLILGLVTRGAALVGLLFQLFLALVYMSSNRWMFEQPHEYVPLIILALVPSGYYWGLDGPLLRNRPSLRRWPF